MDNNEDLNQVNEEETLYDEMNIPEEIPIENYNEDGAYQAKSNKEIQKEKNIETNKKVSKMATEAAANYFGGPAAGKVVNAVNETKMGEKVHDALAKKMHDASRRNILAHETQKTLNNLNDVGAIDAANTALNIVNGDISKEGMAAAAKNSAATNIANRKVTSSNVASVSKNQKNNNFKVPEIDLKNSKILTSKDTKDNLFRKKIMKLIIKHPWLIGVILGIFLILLIVLFIIGSSSDDFSGYGSIAYDGSCSEMPIYGTTLSKNEYVEKVQAYFGPNSKWIKNDDNNKKWASKLYDNAGNMYDIATDNGVNPELVVARAVLEHGDSDYATNNYWGIAVYNGAGSGSSFSTFSEGVLAFVNIVKEYPNAFEMMMRYAYIGTYWAADDSKTGGNCSTSYGGCYYLPYMKDYYDNQDDYEKAASICNKEECKLKREGNYCFVTDASKCVKTRSTDSDVDKVDQIAYAKYQVARMAQQRKFIFGLDPIDCTSYVDEEGNVIDMSNVNDIRQFGEILVQKAISSFDHYKYSLDIQLRDMPGYVDCASLVDRSYKLVGIDYLKHTIPGKSGTTWSEEQWCKENGVLFTNLDPSNLLPGDLLFTAHGSEGYPTHVALYAGNNKTFEATWAHSNSEEDVRVIQYGDVRSYFVSACRPLVVYFKNK